MRPGSNITGIVQLTTALERKRLGLLYEMVTKVDTIAVLVNPTRSIIDAQLAEVREATARLGVKVVILRAKSEAGLEDAFAPLAKQRILIVPAPSHRGFTGGRGRQPNARATSANFNCR